MVKKELPDDDAPLPIARKGSAMANGTGKPKISRKPDGSFVVKYPNGTEKPLSRDRLPANIRAKLDAEQAQGRPKSSNRHFQPSVKREQPEKRKLRIKNDDGPRKKRSAKKVKRERTEGGSDDEGQDDAANAARLRRLADSRTPKDNAIAEFLSRWWYVWPEYPPTNFDYGDELKTNKLREVDIEAWEDEAKTSGGLKKCYMLSTFPGMFRDCEGHLHDLRPNENKPSYNYLNSKSPQEVHALLVKAYTNQIKELADSPYLDIVPGGLERLQKMLDQHKAKSGGMRV